jgi:hypothetical protein
MIQNHDLKAAVDDIMDVMAGADGGIGFANFCAFINRMDELAKKNDKAAQQVLEQVRRFHRLVNIAKN